MSFVPQDKPALEENEVVMSGEIGRCDALRRGRRLKPTLLDERIAMSPSIFNWEVRFGWGIGRNACATGRERRGKAHDEEGVFVAT
jgi:hypothetical protein